MRFDEKGSRGKGCKGQRVQGAKGASRKQIDSPGPDNCRNSGFKGAF